VETRRLIAKQTVPPRDTSNCSYDSQLVTHMLHTAKKGKELFSRPPMYQGC
jgi:hypothetical protein